MEHQKIFKFTELSEMILNSWQENGTLSIINQTWFRKLRKLI